MSLADQARDNAAERDGGGWGYRIALEVDEAFTGRYRGEELVTGGEYGDQTLFLFWDPDGSLCYMRGHASLVRKMQQAGPSIGDDIAVHRGSDYESSGNTGYSYGVAREPNSDPLPEPPDADW